MIALKFTRQRSSRARNDQSLIPIILLGLFVLLSGPSFGVAAEQRVDLELVIATDVSRSIDEREARLQREGTAAALRNSDVIRAIEGGYFKRIAIAYIDYSSAAYNEVIVDWTIIKDRPSAEAFAAKLTEAPLTFGRRTSISDAIEQATRMLDSNAYLGTRRTIDVAGDGPNNHGRLVDEVRAEALAKRITINGLPIISPPGGFGAAFWLDDLDKYYQGCVIGGPGAFLVVARDFKDFARAIRRKLIFEIAQIGPPDQPKLIRANYAKGSAAAIEIANGYTYKKGCDIGERMWQQRFRDSFFGDTP